MLLHHLAQHHPAEVGRFRDAMHTTDDITRVAMQAFEVLEEPAASAEVLQESTGGLQP